MVTLTPIDTHANKQKMGPYTQAILPDLGYQATVSIIRNKKMSHFEDSIGWEAGSFAFIKPEATRFRTGILHRRNHNSRATPWAQDHYA